ncbi:thermonuclease family protein [Luteolibacter sp. AS25]|uniref:thermonuclease family protein n=1 Tax=Luteolibacter sp. AS25 TaxID=3135776 RepID=UPI00398AEE41
MKWLLITVLGLLFSAGQGFSKEWLTYEKCTFVDEKYYDGDSFYVKSPTGYTYIFRLYGVDCAETDSRYPDRLQEQADEFGVEVDELLKWGLEAKSFVKKFLRKPFTVYTQKFKAGGQSKQARYFAVIVNEDGERLDEALVEAGLARAYGLGADWPERTSPERYLRKLHSIESKAKREDVGIWKNSTK